MPRFYDAPESRIIISTWGPPQNPVTPTQDVLTFLDRRATDRVASFQFGGPASFSGSVSSADPEINLLNDDNYSGGIFPYFEDYPLLNEGLRLLHWFRREAPLAGLPWIVRFGGFIMETDDEGGPDVGRTRFTAYDPWQMLYRRPVYRVECIDPACTSTQDYTTPEDALPGPEGVIFLEGTPLNEVVTEMLRRTIVLDGDCGIDAGTAWGGTADYAGTIEVLGNLTQNLVFQQGSTVGQAWQTLVETGAVEIILRPIYDPVSRPGFVCELDVFDTGNAGVYPSGGFPLNQLPLSWDRSGHDLVRLNRSIDGRERASNVQFYVGGPSAGKVQVQLQQDAQSQGRYGNYWNVETRYRTIAGESVLDQAALDLLLRRTGIEVWDLSPTPEWTYRPFQDYDLGSYLNIYNSKRLRQAMPSGFGLQRLFSFSVALSDEGTETVTDARAWVDY